MNRNWEEELDVPVGPDNGFNPAAPIRGSRRISCRAATASCSACGCRTASPRRTSSIWTLTTHGKTEKAYASLRPDYIVDDVVKASETGALGAGTSSPEVRANKPPAVKIDEVRRRARVKVGRAADAGRRGQGRRHSEAARSGARGRGAGRPPADGNRRAPAPRRLRRRAAPATPPRNPAMSPPTRITVGKNLGLHLSWFVYRGPATVTFDPPQIKAWEDTRAGANSPWAPLWAAPKLPADGKQPVQVTFWNPGTYVLRCRADDGALVGEDVTIIVTDYRYPLRTRRS